jgi:hypothetical protein
MEEKLKWYSMNRQLKTEEHEPVTLQEALAILDRYLARAGEKFESAEEAMAATMFGFCRSKSDFIEICINGENQFSYHFEMAEPNPSWLGRLFGGPFKHEEELRFRDELVQRVKEFFTTPASQIRDRYK